jgi:hypothetical protein
VRIGKLNGETESHGLRETARPEAVLYGVGAVIVGPAALVEVKLNRCRGARTA